MCSPCKRHGAQPIPSKDPVAQVVEQLTFNQWVAGSSPAGITKPIRIAEYQPSYWLSAKTRERRSSSDPNLRSPIEKAELIA